MPTIKCMLDLSRQPSPWFWERKFLKLFSFERDSLSLIFIELSPGQRRPQEGYHSLEGGWGCQRSYHGQTQCKPLGCEEGWLNHTLKNLKNGSSQK